MTRTIDDIVAFGRARGACAEALNWLRTQSDVTTASTSLGAAISAGTTAVNANTNTTVLTASTSLGVAINSGTASVNSNTDSRVAVATSSLAAVINANTDTRINTASSSLFATLPNAIWSFSTRTLTSMGSVAADVWGYTTRTLTGAGLDSGSLALQSDVTTVGTTRSRN